MAGLDGRHFWVISQLADAFEMKEQSVSNALTCVQQQPRAPGFLLTSVERLHVPPGTVRTPVPGACRRVSASVSPGGAWQSPACLLVRPS